MPRHDRPRPDLNQRLIECLADPILAGSATNYIRDVAANPSAALAAGDVIALFAALRHAADGIPR